MPLTLGAINSHRVELERKYRDHQALILHGTEKANATQRLKPLPSNYTLLENYRRYRSSGGQSLEFAINRMSGGGLRQWVIVGIDVATRAILGYAFCASPDQNAALAALRMCFADKTPIFRKAGLKQSVWDFRAPIHLVATDSGSEFGKHPFGGAFFGEAVRGLTGSLMNTVAGVPELRAHIERLFRTFELKWARHLPGWTAGAVHRRNDRRPELEACLTLDELEQLFVQFIADYHTSPHRGLDGSTPAKAWEHGMKNALFDITALPGPAALREACGITVRGGIAREGIRYKDLIYSNDWTKSELMKPSAWRVRATSGWPFRIWCPESQDKLLLECRQVGKSFQLKRCNNLILLYIIIDWVGVSMSNYTFLWCGSKRQLAQMRRAFAFGQVSVKCRTASILVRNESQLLCASRPLMRIGNRLSTARKATRAVGACALSPESRLKMP